MKLLLPQIVAHDHRGRAIFLLWPEGSTQLRRETNDVEVVRAYREYVNSSRLVSNADIGALLIVGVNSGE